MHETRSLGWEVYGTIDNDKSDELFPILESHLLLANWQPECYQINAHWT